MARLFPRRLALLALLLLTLAATSGRTLAAQFGQGSGAHAKARLYHRLEGGQLRLAVEVRVDAGWHLYHVELGPEDAVGKPLSIEFEAPGAEFDLPWMPAPHRFEQPGLGHAGRDTWILGFDGRMVLYGRAELDDPDAVLDPEDIRVLLKGLTCEDSGSCVPFDADVSSQGAGEEALFAAFPADWSPAGQLAAGPGADRGVVVEPGSGDTSAAGVSGSPVATAHGSGGVERSAEFYDAFDFSQLKSREQAEQKSLLVFLLLAFVAGMILNVMPCVLPVISIKVLSFVQQAGEDRRRIFQLGVAFAAGIVVVFWALAGLAISANISWGEQFQSAGFLVVMIGAVFAFALSMFGVYEIGVPAQVGQLAGARREGLVDAFFKGVLATVLATPCSGPFLGSTLTWTLKQPPSTVLAIFTSLGFGMALPYVLLTANPKLLKKLPKPGAWMDTFKEAMGFVLLATVVYLMISLEQKLLLYTVAFLLFVALACWWYGRYATFDKQPAQRWAHLGLAALIAAGGARLSFVEFRGLYEGHGQSGWERFEPDRMQSALAEGRSVFVDFTATWCPNCKFNKLTVYDSEEVIAAMAAKGVVRMEADMTNDSPYTRMLERLRNQLGARSIPFMAIFPANQPTEAYVARDIVTKRQVLDVVNELPPAP
jgi:suppressor for copper-sensitivity B